MLAEDANSTMLMPETVDRPNRKLATQFMMAANESALSTALEQVGSVIASFVDVRGLCCAAMSWRAFYATTEAEIERRVQATELGRSLLARHAGEFPVSRLAFCVEICPVPGQYMDQDIQMPKTSTKDHLTAGDIWGADLVSGWCRVLFVIDGYVVYERVEAHYKFTRFPAVR